MTLNPMWINNENKSACDNEVDNYRWYYRRLPFFAAAAYHFPRIAPREQSAHTKNVLPSIAIRFDLNARRIMARLGSDNEPICNPAFEPFFVWRPEDDHIRWRSNDKGAVVMQIPIENSGAWMQKALETFSGLSGSGTSLQALWQFPPDAKAALLPHKVSSSFCWDDVCSAACTKRVIKMWLKKNLIPSITAD